MIDFLRYCRILKFAMKKAKIQNYTRTDVLDNKTETDKSSSNKKKVKRSPYTLKKIKPRRKDTWHY